MEECKEDILNDREIYWIAYFNTYANGYNATLGGDSKAYISETEWQEMISAYNRGNSVKDIAKAYHHDAGYVAQGLKSRGIAMRDNKNLFRQRIWKCDLKTHEKLESYPSAAEAARAIGVNDGSHIRGVCNGKRQSAYGFFWIKESLKDL